MKITIYLFIYFFLSTLHASEFHIVVNDAFPLKTLTKKQLKSIYLKKVSYIDGVKILAINISSNDPLRTEFEKAVLSMNKKSLKAYWSKAHYRGIRPPKVLKSSKNILSYIASIEGAIAYISKEIKSENLRIIEVE